MLTAIETEATCDACCGPIRPGDYLVRVAGDDYYVCAVCAQEDQDLLNGDEVEEL